MGPNAEVPMRRRLTRLAPAILATLGFATAATAQDSDGDTVPDASDNCDLVLNTPQTNTDGDAFGNACDPDYDGTGVVGFADLMFFRTNFTFPVPPGSPHADHEDPPNGIIGLSDFLVFLTYWSGPPGP